MMGRIYRQARRLIVWLGECFQDETQQFRERQFLKNCPERRFQIVRELLDRPWFRRRWVVQEALCAPSYAHYWLLGQFAFDSCRLMRLIQPVESSQLTIHDMLQSAPVLAIYYSEFTGKSSRFPLNHWRTVKLVRKKAKAEVYDYWRLLEVLFMLHTAGCQNVHDAVFTVFGIFEESLHLDTDYSKDFADLCRSIASSYVIGSFLDLTPFAQWKFHQPSYCYEWFLPTVLLCATIQRPGTNPYTAQLASWIPDWSAFPQYITSRHQEVAEHFLSHAIIGNDQVKNKLFWRVQFTSRQYIVPTLVDKSKRSIDIHGHLFVNGWLFESPTYALDELGCMHCHITDGSYAVDPRIEKTTNLLRSLRERDRRVILCLEQSEACFVLEIVGDVQEKPAFRLDWCFLQSGLNQKYCRAPATDDRTCIFSWICKSMPTMTVRIV